MAEIDKNQGIQEMHKNSMNRRLEALGWGLFFIWVGIAFIFDMGWGAGFIGIGVIILGKLAAREYLSVSTGSGETKVKC